MDFSPEIAVLRSTFHLLNKQLGEKLLVLTKSDSSHVTEVLGGAVEEIVEGLECDRTVTDKEHWQFKVHSLLLFKIINTHYSDSEGEITGSPILSLDLPGFSKASYFELVKHLNWQNLFVETIHWLDPNVAAELLFDFFTHIQSDPVGEHDTQSAAVLLECLCHWLLSLKFQTIVSHVHKSGDPVFEPEKCLETLIKFDCYFCKNLLQFLCRKNDNQADGECLQFCLFGEQTFSQVVLIGLSCFGNVTELQEWIHFNFYSPGGEDIKSEITNRQVPDLDVNVIKLLNQQLSVGDWVSCVSQLLKNEHIRPAPSEREDMSSGTAERSECRGIAVVEHIFCDRLIIIQRLQAFIVHIEEQTSQLTQQELIDMKIVKQDVTALLEENPVPELQFSVNAVIWHITNKLPGCEECLQKLLSCRDEVVWSDNRIMSALERNIDLLAHDVVVESVISLMKWMKSLDPHKDQQIQQITLDAIVLLPLSSQDRLIVRIYLERCDGHLSDSLFSNDGNIISQVTAVFNKITSDDWVSIVPDTCKLLLIDPVTTIRKAVDMFARNVGQGPILVKVFQSFPSLCRVKHPVFHPQRSLLGSSICDFMEKNQLTPTEKQNFIQTFSVAIQALKTADEREKEAILSVKELLAFNILPFININYFRTDHSGRTSFALQCLAMLLTPDKKCKVDCDWIKEMQPVSCLACLCELLHQCVVIWNGDSCEQALLRLQVRELVVKCLDLLIDKMKGSLLTERCAIWMYRHISDLDWTIPLYVQTLFFSSQQILEDFAKSVLQSQVRDNRIDCLVNLLRFAAASDAALTAMTKAMSCCPVVDYEVLVLDLAQLLPNLVMIEWSRVASMIQWMLNRGLMIPHKSQFIESSTDLQDYRTALLTSQLLLDVTAVLQTCSEVEVTTWNHFAKNYITTVKHIFEETIKQTSESINQSTNTFDDDNQSKEITYGAAQSARIKSKEITHSADQSARIMDKLLVLAQIFCDVIDTAMFIPIPARETLIHLLYHLVSRYAELSTEEDASQKVYRNIMLRASTLLDHDDRRTLLSKLSTL